MKIVKLNESIQVSNNLIEELQVCSVDVLGGSMKNSSTPSSDVTTMKSTLPLDVTTSQENSRYVLSLGRSLFPGVIPKKFPNDGLVVQVVGYQSEGADSIPIMLIFDLRLQIGVQRLRPLGHR